MAVALALGCMVVAVGCSEHAATPPGSDDEPRAGESAAPTSASPDDPYEYPSLSSVSRADPQLAMESLQVPDEDLAAMSTQALVKTVLSFPYAVNLLAYSSPRQAVHSVAEQCNALSDLLGRADMAEQVQAVLGQVERGEFTVDGVSGELLALYLEVLANPEASGPLPEAPN